MSDFAIDSRLGAANGLPLSPALLSTAHLLHFSPCGRKIGATYMVSKPSGGVCSMTVQMLGHERAFGASGLNSPLGDPAACPLQPTLSALPKALLFRYAYARGKGRVGGVASVMRFPSGSRTCASVE